MPTRQNTLRLFTCAAALVVVGLTLGTPVQASGHCMYKKLSPGSKVWYAACRMPTAAQDCDEWAMTEGVSGAKYADGPCPSRGTVGACVLGAVSQYFYGVPASAAAEGCKYADGSWQPDSTPGS